MSVRHSFRIEGYSCWPEYRIRSEVERKGTNTPEGRGPVNFAVEEVGLTLFDYISELKGNCKRIFSMGLFKSIPKNGEIIG